VPQRYSQQVVIDGVAFDYEKVLKADFFSVNVLYRNASGQRYVLKLSDFRFIFGLLLRPLAMLMSWHEYRMYRKVDGLEGIPRLGPRHGWRGYFHQYVEGQTLKELMHDWELPADFFDRLGELLRQVHGRGVFYADLSKSDNVIRGDDGRPYLIDFQISVPFGRYGGAVGRWLSRLFDRLKAMDLYHVYKHKKWFHTGRMSAEQWRLAERPDWCRTWYTFWLSWYLPAKRLLYPHGSNDLIWFKNKRRDPAPSPDDAN